LALDRRASCCPRVRDWRELVLSENEVAEDREDEKEEDEGLSGGARSDSFCCPTCFCRGTQRRWRSSITSRIMKRMRELIFLFSDSSSKWANWASTHFASSGDLPMVLPMAS